MKNPLTGEKIPFYWEKFYEASWEARFSKMKELVEKGEDHPLRIINQTLSFTRFYRTTIEQNKIQYETSSKFEPIENVFKLDSSGLDVQLNAPLPNGRPISKKVPFMNQYVTLPEYYFKSISFFLLEYLKDKKFDAIVELGSGFSQNLIELYYHGGPRVPYYSGEFTQSGQDCSKMLQGLDPQLPLDVFYFDHKNPDLSHVKGDNLFIFTCHSIEQVEEIPNDYMMKLCEGRKSVEGMHLEPFGYQFQWDPASPVDVKQMHFFTEQGWNKNLVSVLSKNHRAKKIRVKYLSKNCLGGEDSANPTSLAVWESLPSS